ncbi:MAG: HEAT repeat domain-containing protein [Gemmatimonadota bacterium]|nr:MAG: HEAT repeat domain-containing protein [Gemmatimonadota bacterium]
MRTRDLVISVASLALLLAGGAPVGLAAPQEPAADAARSEYRAALEVASLYPQEPGDSLYRAARVMLNQENYRRAAELFRQIYSRYPRSSYAAQALYYQAFALYREGTDSDLRTAQEALSTLQRQYGEARIAQREAASLLARVQGELARRGYAEAAEAVVERARGVAEARERDVEAAEAVVERARGVAEATQRDVCEDEVRLAALNALLHMSAEQALPILKRILERRDDDECSVMMRRKAVFLVAQHVDDETIDILLDIVRNDPDREVRSQAVFWLSQVHGERAVDALEEILLRSDDHELQEKAIFALSQHESERSSRILRDYAMQEGAPVELRDRAIFWIGQHRSEANARFLRELYGSTQESELKEKIIFSLAQMGGEENGRWLLDIAVDESEPIEVRKRAIFWAGQMGVSIVQMAELYDRMPDHEMKGQIIFALSQQGDRAAVDKLMEIGRTEQDTELRKKAIFWLSQSDDPRVAEFLLTIIEGQ